MIPRGKTLVGLAMIIIASGCGQSKPVTTTTTDPILLTRESIEFYGVTFEAPFDSIIAQGDFELYSCPQFGCDVVGTVELGERVNVTGGIVGEPKDGFTGWIITEVNNRTRYAHIYDAMPIEATRNANLTAQPTVNTGRFELTPTLLSIVADTPLCDEPKNDCNVLADLTAGDVVVTFAFVDGDGGVWVQVNYNNVIGYVVLDALDTGGGE